MIIKNLYFQIHFWREAAFIEGDRFVFPEMGYVFMKTT